MNARAVLTSTTGTAPITFVRTRDGVLIGLEDGSAQVYAVADVAEAMLALRGELTAVAPRVGDVVADLLVPPEGGVVEEVLVEYRAPGSDETYQANIDDVLVLRPHEHSVHSGWGSVAVADAIPAMLALPGLDAVLNLMDRDPRDVAAALRALANVLDGGAA